VTTSTFLRYRLKYSSKVDSVQGVTTIVVVAKGQLRTKNWTDKASPTRTH
jgi:hypothetical protein